MMNSDAGGVKPVADNTKVDDFDDLDQTAVLDPSADPEQDDQPVGIGFDDEDESAFEKTAVLPETDAVTDNVGDVSVEINVEELIADFEASDDKEAARKREIRRRLEDVVEDKSFEDTYAIDVGEDAD